MKAFEKISYLTAAAGIVGDQMSTRLALTKPHVYETNGATVAMMRMGLWLPLDALLSIASIAIPAILMKRWAFEGRWAVLVFPLILGLCRIVATIWNIHLLFGGKWLQPKTFATWT